VAFDTPVAREYLGSEGHLAVRGDVASLADKIITSLYPAATDIWSLEMGKRLRQRVMQRFAWEQAGQMIVSTYRELIERGGRKVITPQPTEQLVERTKN
jgi:glycosyltransferase involved in cell wall biosynthesis